MAGPGIEACGAHRTLGPAEWCVVLEGRIESVRKMSGCRERTGSSWCHWGAEMGGSGYVGGDGGYCCMELDLESRQLADQYQITGSGLRWQWLSED